MNVNRYLRQDGAIFTGTRQALIASGVCRDDVFPGDPGDPRKKDRRGIPHGRFMSTDPQGRAIHISRFHDGTFRVDRELTELEAAEIKRSDREEQEREILEQDRELREQQERRAAKDRTLYKTAEEFKEEQAILAGALPLSVIKNMASGRYGWRLCEEDHARLVGLKAALVEAIRSARVVRDGEETKPRLYCVK